MDDARCFVTHNERALGEDMAVYAAVDPEVDLLDGHDQLVFVYVSTDLYDIYECRS